MVHRGVSLPKNTKFNTLRYVLCKIQVSNYIHTILTSQQKIEHCYCPLTGFLSRRDDYVSNKMHAVLTHCVITHAQMARKNPKCQSLR